MSMFKYKDFDSKLLKQINHGWETEMSAHAIISVKDPSIRDGISYHFDTKTKKLTLLGYNPTGHKLKIGYIPEASS